MTLMRDRSGRSGRRRGSQKPGTLTGGCTAAPSAAAGAAANNAPATTSPIMSPMTGNKPKTGGHRYRRGCSGTIISGGGAAARGTLIDDLARGASGL